MEPHPHQDQDQDPGRARGRVVSWFFLALTAFFLWTEHRAHLLGALPYLLVLACPLMHLFHHRHGHRHGHQHGHQHHTDHDDTRRSP